MTKYASSDTTTIAADYLTYYFHPQLSMLTDGGWVAAWEHRSSDSSEYGTVFQRFNANGGEIGSEVLLAGMAHKFAGLPAGGWVVAYNDYDNTPANDVFVNFYDSQGAVIAAGVQANSYTEGYQTINAVTALADGGWVVTWSGFGADNHNDTDNEIYQQRFSANGAAIGNNVRVNTTVESEQSESRVVGLADGGWVVCWNSDGQDGDGSGVYMQRYDADGNAVGSEERIHVATSGSQLLSSLVALPDGGWLVTWQNARAMGEGGPSQFRRFDAAGEPTPELEASGAPKVAVFDDGSYVMVYYRIVDGNEGEYDQAEIRAQVYNADGSINGREYIVDREDYLSPGPGYDVDIVGNHDFIVTWQHTEHGIVSPVEQRRYSPGLNEAPVVVNDTASMLERDILRVDVLANDYDPEGDNRLTLESAKLVSGNAAVSVTEDGQIIILDKSSGIGSGSETSLKIEYQVSDGFDFVMGTLEVTVDGVTDRGDHLYGTRGADVMRGSNVAEIFHGKGGGDEIQGDNGKDVIFGNGGNDELEGNEGNDVIIGGRGNDNLSGGDGDDAYIISKGDGRDRIDLGGSSDVIDLSDFDFKSFDALNKLAKVKGYDVVIDLPGKDWLFIEDGAYFSVGVIL